MPELALDNSLFSSVELDPVSVILGTGYYAFESPLGVHGLMKHDETRLDILAIGAHKQGRGACRCFIAQAKKRFRVICIWHVDNPILREALQRYGFKPTKEIQESERITGYRWEESV